MVVYKRLEHGHLIWPVELPHGDEAFMWNGRD